MSHSQFGFLYNTNSSNDLLFDELALEILANLSIEDLLRGPENCPIFTSKQFARVGLSDNFWKRLFKKCFLVDIEGPGCMRKFLLHYTCEEVLKISNPDSYKLIILATEEERKKLVQAAIILCNTYQKLRDFIDADTQGKDDTWTKYLLAKFYKRQELQQNFARTLNYTHCLKEADKLMYQAATQGQGNPLAMFDVTDYWFRYEGVTDENKQSFLIKAHERGCLHATYRMAMWYCRFSDRRKNLLHISKYFDLLLHAAKKDHNFAAFQLSKCYLKKLTSPGLIPLGDNDWAAFTCMKNIYQLKIEMNFMPEVVNKQLSDLSELALAGSVYAARELAKLYQSDDNVLGIAKNTEVAAYYANLSASNYAAALPDRLERAKYWLEQGFAGKSKFQDDRYNQYTSQLMRKIKKLEKEYNIGEDPQRSDDQFNVIHGAK